MPPHCDTLDGPVVNAAREALKAGNVNLILPYVPKKAEDELKQAFDKTLRARALGPEAMEVADYWFFETAVRLHRAGEGAPYTGLKPAGLDEGPAISHATKALNEGDPKEAINFLLGVIENSLEKRFHDAATKKHYDVNDVGAAREYVEASLGFLVFAHHLHQFVMSAGSLEKTESEHKAA